jgi:hypothetical protein
MSGQVFQGRSRLRRSILGAARVLAFVAAGALLVVIVASAVAPSAPLDLSPFVSAPGANPGGSPTPTPAIVQVLNGAGNAIGAAASAIAAPFGPAATPTPTVAPTTQPTPRGGQPSTLPGHTPTPTTHP